MPHEVSTTSWSTAPTSRASGCSTSATRANAREIAYADPAPLPKPPNANFQIGGDWGSYFYNGYIYESDITRGLYVWKLSDRDTERAMRLRHLNPQTLEFTIGARKDHDRWNKGDKWHDDRLCTTFFIDVVAPRRRARGGLPGRPLVRFP